MLASPPAHYPNLGKVGRFWVGGWLGAYKKILKNANFFEKKNMFYNIKKNFQNTCTIKNKALNLQCN